tara:strand:- start:671 stop:1672 length:1002 start_codon:yes stop_codon:yes gene_type:complete
MLKLSTKKNISINVPENLQEDISIRFHVNEKEEAKKYYENNGYVIFKKCIDSRICKEIMDLWSNSIKTYKGSLYRQTTGKAERNIFNEKGWVMNPVFNIQSLNPSLFFKFKSQVENGIFNNIVLCDILNKFLNKKPKIIQSMYFEGNSVTGEHQDTYYLDSNNIGTLTAAWIALEEIKADAGRFFICEKSHKIDISKLKYFNNILSNHKEYIDELISLCKKNNLTFKAPLLKQGDILFWNSKTLHGSLNSQSKNFSRSSITLHAIADGDDYFHWHKHIIKTPADDLGNAFIYRRKNQKKLINKIILYFESNYSNFFYSFKKIIAKIIYKQKHY